MLGEILDPPRSSRYAVQGRANPASVLALPAADMAAHYNRQPFLVRHRLADEPLLALPELIALCRRLPAGQVRFRVGEIPGDADFDDSYRRYRQALTLDAVLDDIEAQRAYLCIYNPEKDARFRPLADRLIADLAAACAMVGERLTWFSGYVFLSTRGSVTPYHMDREMNFLLQVRGNKEVCLWDPADPIILPPARKDALLAYDGLRPPYDPAFESRAMRYAIGPGTGVHHPFIAPHRVHTTDALSVSLACTFRTDRSDRITAVHRVNRTLRRLGLSPGPPGLHPAADALKAGVVGLARQARRAMRAY